MCRIYGGLGFGAEVNRYNRKNLEIVGAALASGGPDSSGIFIDERNNLALGHRRLAIIDLTRNGHQPMSSHDGRFKITYNGEIYNFEHIKEELQNEGVRFVSKSDTEVILEAWAHWGSDCLNKFRGMFAFAIWDSLTKALYLVRDRFGVKPLYYSISQSGIEFASELKGLRLFTQYSSALSPISLSEYLSKGYISQNKSIDAGTLQVPPGSFLKIEKTGNYEIIRYYDSLRMLRSPSEYKSFTSSEPLITQVEKRIIENVQLRSIADVEIGCFLSGGIDSSLLTAILKNQLNTQIKTFTISFDDPRLDEAIYAEKVASFLGTEHFTFEITKDDLIEGIVNLPKIMDEPFADVAAVPTALLCKKAGRHVKVAMSGDGGDEFFMGYLSHQQIPRLSEILSRYQWIFRHILPFVNPEALTSPLNIVSRLTKHRKLSDNYRKIHNILGAKDHHGLIAAYGATFDIRQIKKLMRHNNELINYSVNTGQEEEITTAIDRFYINEWLVSDALVKTDRISMAYGLELREPLLDHTLFELSRTIPRDQNINNKTGKVILRDILKKYVPEDITERRKQGFKSPIDKWLKDELRELTEYYLSEDCVRKYQVLNYIPVQRLMTDFFKYDIGKPGKIWNLLMLQIWASNQNLI